MASSPRSRATATRIAAATASGGLSYPPPHPSVFGVADPGDEAWLARRLTPQPLRAYTEPFGLRAPLGNGLPVRYLACTAPAYPAVHSAHAIARREAAAERWWPSAM